MPKHGSKSKPHGNLPAPKKIKKGKKQMDVEQSTFDKLMRNESKTHMEAVLCQAIAELSTAKGYTHMTPWAVFDKVEKNCGEVGWESAKGTKND